MTVADGDDAPEYQPPAENVISIIEVLERVHRQKECRHRRFEIDDQNRRVTCMDCKREVDPIEALIVMAAAGSEWHLRWDALRTDYRNLAGWVPHMRAVRKLEGLWHGKRLPMCPHCKKGVTAEGLSSMGWVHQSYAEAVAKHEAETAVKTDVVHLHDGGSDGI